MPTLPAMLPARLSIIVPVLDEAHGIADVLQHLQPCRQQGAELIVVDGGSADDTEARARPLADRVLNSARGRGRQLNAGAQAAQGEILLFLHADTVLPDSALALIRDAMASGSRWGRFDVRIEGSLAGLGMVAFMMNWRSRITGIATGDQAIFITADAFRAHGGFAEIPLMEDIEFSTKMRKQARPACLAARVTTSGRRWEKHGLLRTILSMWWLRLRFFLGTDPAVLAREYGYRPHEA